jgi:hypothetical protein
LDGHPVSDTTTRTAPLTPPNYLMFFRIEMLLPKVEIVNIPQL